jgi:hypothetical protein
VDPTAERVARNNATFRDANERIEAAAADASLDLVPFICECTDERCTEIVPLSLLEYERIRADPTHFLYVPGHEVRADGWAHVVDRGERHVVTEKEGEAAEIAAELDPRREAESA